MSLATIVNQDAPNGCHVLVVEDDDDDAGVLESILLRDRRVGQLVRAVNGEEAIGWLEQAGHRPDLIIVDLNMPVLDGHGFLTQLRMARGFKHVPVAVLTCSSRAADYHRALVRRADTFITKPDEVRRLISVVDRLLQHLAGDRKFPVLLAA